MSTGIHGNVGTLRNNLEPLGSGVIKSRLGKLPGDILPAQLRWNKGMRNGHSPVRQRVVQERLSIVDYNLESRVHRMVDDRWICRRVAHQESIPRPVDSGKSKKHRWLPQIDEVLRTSDYNLTSRDTDSLSFTGGTISAEPSIFLARCSVTGSDGRHVETFDFRRKPPVLPVFG